MRPTCTGPPKKRTTMVTCYNLDNSFWTNIFSESDRRSRFRNYFSPNNRTQVSSESLDPVHLVNLVWGYEDAESDIIPINKMIQSWIWLYVYCRTQKRRFGDCRTASTSCLSAENKAKVRFLQIISMKRGIPKYRISCRISLCFHFSFKRIHRGFFCAVDFLVIDVANAMTYRNSMVLFCDGVLRV